jgi:hypothetical protein
MPNELLSNILQECVGYHPIFHLDHRNRYTRFALIARQVCRLWKEMVDLPSHYHFRTSAAHLWLNIFTHHRGSNPPDIHLENHMAYQNLLANSKSMLVIDLKVFFGICDEFSLAALPPVGSEKIRKFLQAVDDLTLYKERLVDLNMRAPPGEFGDYMLDSIRSLDHSVTQSFTFKEDV